MNCAGGLGRGPGTGSPAPRLQIVKEQVEKDKTSILAVLHRDTEIAEAFIIFEDGEDFDIC